MKTQILYTTRKPKPQPTPAPAKAPAPAPSRITIDWGISGRLHLNRSKAPECDQQQQTQREGSAVLRPTPVETPRCRVEQVDRSSRLERVRRPKPLCDILAEYKSDFRALEYLAVLKVGDREYAIAQRTTSEIFVDQAFETRQYCYDAAVELEQTFDMAIVLERMEPETMALIEDLAEWHYMREWVALGLV